MVEQWSPKPRAEGSSPSAPAKYADVAQVVAHILGKDEVTSSSLVISSKTVIEFSVAVFFLLLNKIITISSFPDFFVKREELFFYPLFL